MKRSAFCLCLSFTLALVCCQPSDPADTSKADEAAIRGFKDQFLAAINAADLSGFDGLYTDDAVQLPPDGAALVGLEAIMQGFTEQFAEFDATQTAEVEDVQVVGDIGYSHGTWNVTQTPKAGGGPQPRNGKWTTVARRQADGSWKIWRWMWNEEGKEVPSPK
jgi:uncharacterized protein (TIGR02246 family)